MIKTFRHRGLKEIYEQGHSSKVAHKHAAKLMRVLTALDRSSSPEGMDIPGFRLHRLKGRMKGCYSISVSANWRVIFRLEESHVLDVDYLDYH